MPRISPREFERLPLRVHQVLAGVSLHDVGRSICREPARESRWMSSCAQPMAVRSGPRWRYEHF